MSTRINRRVPPLNKTCSQSHQDFFNLQYNFLNQINYSYYNNPSFKTENAVSSLESTISNQLSSSSSDLTPFNEKHNTNFGSHEFFKSEDLQSLSTAADNDNSNQNSLNEFNKKRLEKETSL